MLSDGARAPKIAMCIYDGNNYAYVIQYRGVSYIRVRLARYGHARQGILRLASVYAGRFSVSEASDSVRGRTSCTHSRRLSHYCRA